MRFPACFSRAVLHEWAEGLQQCLHIGPPTCPTCYKVHAGNQMEWQWSGGFLAVVGPEINRCVEGSCCPTERPDSLPPVPPRGCLGRLRRNRCMEGQGEQEQQSCIVQFPLPMLIPELAGVPAAPGDPPTCLTTRSCHSTHTGYRLANITANVVKGQRRLGVSKTTGIAVGQWVRLWARSPLSTRRGRSLLEPARWAAQNTAGAQAGRAERTAVARTSSRRLQAGPGGFLPLSPAMEEAWRQAQVGRLRCCTS